VGEAGSSSRRAVDEAASSGDGSTSASAAGLRPADLLALTKPRITGLVSLVACAAYLAAGEAAGAGALASLLVGTALLAGGTNALNQVVEREEDGRMARTRDRPLPAGRLRTGPAVGFASALVVGGTGLLLAGANLLTAGLGLASALLYVAAYTPLKRRTALALPVGAVPGALPALGGWTAATGRIDAAGLGLFGVLFLWQIPHFVALGWLHRDDYRRAGFAMVAARDASGARSSEWAVLSALALLPVSLLPTLLGIAGWAYAAAAVVAGAGFLALAARMSAGLVGLPGEAAGRDGPEEARGDRSARELFVASLAYLPAVLLALAVDVRLLGSATPGAEQLPTLNAGLNAAAALGIVGGLVMIRRGRVAAHRAFMLLAAAASAVFLGSYLVYHFEAGSVAFEGGGWLRTLYFGVLITHAVLAVAVVPLVVVALSRALRGGWEGHRRIVRWTVPVWLYVSVTGVVVYYMVYVM
jgi:protoheme IX farnesyltransferase